MSFIKILYNGEKDTQLSALGERILYYTDYRNFSSVHTQTNESIESQVKCPAVPTYKEVDGEYIETTDFNASIPYYIEEGTLEVDCPACGQQSERPGYLKGDDNKYYICPRCGGKGTLIMAINPSLIISINVSQNSLEEDGYAVSYRVVPGGKTGQTNTNMNSIVIENENFVDKSDYILVRNHWQNLLNKLEEYYNKTSNINVNFYTTVKQRYQERLKEINDLIE